MNSRHYILAALLVSAPCAWGASPQNGTGETDGYRLVWQDLFDSGKLNPARWTMEVNGNGGGNNELQSYTDRTENVRVGNDDHGNGCLILTARREEYNGRHFTSGRVISKNKVAFKHGKIEASIRLPQTANGLWPAFWMMGNDFDQVGWPRCGETDIVEMGNVNGIRRGKQDRLFNGAMHWGPSWKDHPMYARESTWDYSLQDGEFHLFTVFWDENEVRMYLDLDKHPNRDAYFRMTIPENEPENEYNPGNYFHKENFLLFNLAVGGDFTDIHTQEGITALNEGNSQQASMMINYVKIYQKGEGDETATFPDSGDPQPDDTAVNTVESDRAAIRIIGDKIILDTPSDIRLYDISGLVHMQATGSELSLEELPKGLYIIRTPEASCIYRK